MAPVTCIILLAGVKRCGKDTVADYLCSKHGFSKLSFAAPLKAICQYTFDLTTEQVDGADKEKIDERYNKSARQIIQYFGTDLMQIELMKFIPNIGRHIWVNKVMSTIREMEQHDLNTKNKGLKIVISDTRFKHEYDIVRNTYPEVTKLIRIHNDNAETAAASDQHVSETDWLSLIPDAHLYNNDSKDELYKQIDELIS